MLRVILRKLVILKGLFCKFFVFCSLTILKGQEVSKVDKLRKKRIHKRRPQKISLYHILHFSPMASLKLSLSSPISISKVGVPCSKKGLSFLVKAEHHSSSSSSHLQGLSFLTCSDQITNLSSNPFTKFVFLFDFQINVRDV